MRFLFIYPPGNWSAGMQRIHPDPFAPPLGILYLCSTLEKSGHKCEVIDFWAERFGREKLEKTLPHIDVVGVSVASFNLDPSMEICKIIKEADSDLPLLIGGPHVTLYPEKTLLKSGADIAVKGEGEAIIESIARAVEGKAELKDIDGIFFVDGGKIVKGKEPKVIKDLDALPFPDRTLVSKYEYGFLFGSKLGKGKFTSIITSRGCPLRCRFCQRKFFGMNQFRMRSAENVIEELKTLKGRFNSVLFADDNFLVNRRRAEKILDGIIEEDMDIEFWAETRVSDVDMDILVKMKKAGFKVISFGLESGNQDVLDFYRKGITTNQIRRAVTLSRKLGYYTSGTFILGAPIEEEKHFERTIEFAKSIPLDVTAFFVLEYGAGSPLWEEAVKQGKIGEEEYLVLADSARGLSKFTKEEIDLYCRRGHKEFYVRPKYILDQIFQAFRRKDFRLLKALLRIALKKEIRERYWGS